jgi:hypothetical protein
MTDLPTLAATLLANYRTIRVPASGDHSKASEDHCGQPTRPPPDWFQTVKARRAARRAAEIYRCHLRRELVEHGYHRFFHHLEADPEGGWRLHFFVADEPALSILADINEGQCGPGDPVDFDPEQFVTEHLGRLYGMDPDCE